MTLCPTIRASWRTRERTEPRFPRYRAPQATGPAKRTLNKSHCGWSSRQHDSSIRVAFGSQGSSPCPCRFHRGRRMPQHRPCPDTRQKPSCRDRQRYRHQGSTAGKADFSSLAQDEVHQEHAVNRLGNRGTHEHQQGEESALALGISLLPHGDGGHTSRSATKGGAHCRNAKSGCSTPITTEQPLAVLSPARLAPAESLSGSR